MTETVPVAEFARAERAVSDVRGLIDAHDALTVAQKKLDVVRGVANFCAKYADTTVIRADMAWQLRTILDGDPNTIADAPVTTGADVRMRVTP